MTLSKGKVIKVMFFSPIDGETEYFFGSLAAIYEMFTPQQIGCKIEALWSAKIELGKPKATRSCIISKHVVLRKKQEGGK